MPTPSHTWIAMHLNGYIAIPTKLSVKLTLLLILLYQQDINYYNGSTNQKLLVTVAL